MFYVGVRKAYRSLVSLLAFIVLVDCVYLSACGQEQETSTPSVDDDQSQVDTSKPLTWQEACKLIGDSDPNNVARIDQALRLALREPQRSEADACAWLLHAISRGDHDAAKAALAGIRSVFPNPSVETQAFTARARMWLWITSTDPKEQSYSNGTFRELVTTAHRGALPKPELRAHAKLIGTLCGMLQFETAESPILESNLKVAEQCLTDSKSADVKSNFKQQFQASKIRAESLHQTMEKLKAKDPDAIAEEQAVRKQKLAELGYEFTSAKELMIEVVRNARELSRQNTHDRRRLADLIAKINRDWMTPTPGHPGQPPIEPHKPVKSKIKVEEYETVFDGYETETDSEGNKYKVRKEKRERKSQSEIDRERDAKYAQLMQQYNVLKADYDRRIAVYIPLLKSWNEADILRRQKLKEDRAAAEARSDQLREANKQLQVEASAAKSEYRDQRSDVEVLAEEYELTEIASQAIAANSIASAYRPPHFDVIDVEDEKFRILGRQKK